MKVCLLFDVVVKVSQLLFDVVKRVFLLLLILLWQKYVDVAMKVLSPVWCTSESVSTPFWRCWDGGRACLLLSALQAVLIRKRKAIWLVAWGDHYVTLQGRSGKGKYGINWIFQKSYTIWMSWALANLSTLGTRLFRHGKSRDRENIYPWEIGDTNLEGYRELWTH